jgi:hypothetical protein
LRDALAQLQMAFAREVGPASEEKPAAPKAPEAGRAGPAQTSGRLWVPGQ